VIAAEKELYEVWSVALIAVALVFVPYLAMFRRRRSHDHARKLEASVLGVDRPVAQYPHVDPAVCIGCGACARACPEGDVLGVVGGVAVVINGLRCVGHGHCATACPVGAIEVGLGDLKSRTDVPLLDDDLETSVPGIYVAGELSGLALIRNAVEQGRRVVDRISAAGASAPRRGVPLDLAIVGAGPAGLAAALRASRLGLQCVVLEREASLGGTLLHYPRRKLVLTRPVEIDPWGTLDRDEYAKEELLDVFADMVARFRIDVRFAHDVNDVHRHDGFFELRTPQASFAARSVLLALGRRGAPRRLEVPGEDLAKVTYRLQDAASYERQRLLVVGGGDSAVEAAIGLAREGRNQVHLSYRREKLLRVKRKNQEAFDKLVGRGRIQPLYGSEVERITADAVDLRLAGGEARRIENDYVFVLVGGVPPFDFLRRIGIHFGGSAAPTAREGAG